MFRKVRGRVDQPLLAKRFARIILFKIWCLGAEGTRFQLLGVSKESYKNKCGFLFEKYYNNRMKKTGGKKDIEALLKSQTNKITNEIKGHMSALGEEYQGRMEAVAEQVGGIKEDITQIKDTLDSHTKLLNTHTVILNSHTETLNSHTETIGSIKEDIEVIKSDISTIKLDLKKKVDYDEFATLEKRVARLESKRG